ncbi:MAG: hypothetical protein Q8876_08140 [Bacillota bacterium]|nr:hypothetical protein [Bacillota bacterium]
MKRILLLVLIAAMACCFTSCSSQPAHMNTGSTLTSDESAHFTTVPVGKQLATLPDGHTKTQYKNDIEGLATYLLDCGFLSGEVTKNMSAATIGAAEGWRYQFSFNSSNVSVELYRYDPSNLDSTAKNIIDQVKKSSSFNMLDIGTVQNVYLTYSGKYMLIYNDSKAQGSGKDKSNESRKNAVLKAFMGFESNAVAESATNLQSISTTPATTAATK